MLASSQRHPHSQIGKPASPLPLPVARPGLHLFWADGVQHDLVSQLLGVGRVAFAPVIADGVCEDVAAAVESGAGDGAAHGGVSLETVLGVFIPEVERAVTAGGAERTMDRVEGDGVNGEDVVDFPLGLTMALKAEVGAGVLLFDILDSTAALDAADGEPCGVGEAADNPRLPLEGGLHGLVEFGGVVEVDDVDVPVSGADHEELVLDVHGVDPLLTLHSRNWGRLSQIPVFDSLVPRAGH